MIQVLIELAEQDEWSAAEAVFARAECLDLLRVQDVDRYMRIQKMVHARHMYAKGMDHAARRQHLASGKGWGFLNEKTIEQALLWECPDYGMLYALSSLHDQH